MKKVSINANLQVFSHESGIRVLNPNCPNCDFILDENIIANFFQKKEKSRINLKSLINVGITKRELEVINFLTQGKNAREIAEILTLSRRTVEHYIENIKFKLKVKKKSELIEKVLRTENDINHPFSR